MKHVQSLVLLGALLVGLGACAGAPDQPTTGATTQSVQPSTTLAPRVPLGVTVVPQGQSGPTTAYPKPGMNANPAGQPGPYPANPYPGATRTKAP